MKWIVVMAHLFHVVIAYLQFNERNGCHSKFFYAIIANDTIFHLFDNLSFLGFVEK